MKQIITASVILLFISCASPDKENKVEAPQVTTLTKSSATTASLVDTNWVTYIDSINTGFVVSFKYPKHLYVEHFENAECIGKRIKMTEDGQMTTQDCSMWMEDISKNNIRPVDTLNQYVLQRLESDAKIIKDSLDIAGVKGLRSRFFAIKDNKLLRQSIYFSKYNTFFEVYNDSLPANEFDMFVRSLRIEK